jgi:hypothetical protein
MEPHPRQRGIPAVFRSYRPARKSFTNCQSRLYLAKEDEMPTTLTLLVAFAGIGLSARNSPAAEPRDLVGEVRGCTQRKEADCRALTSDLATRLEGMDPTDKTVGARLGAVAANAVEHPAGMVAGVAESCRVGYEQACVTLAKVLDGLFSGDDARLQRSTDRLLARELARTLVSALDPEPRLAAGSPSHPIEGGRRGAHR